MKSTVTFYSLHKIPSNDSAPVKETTDKWGAIEEYLDQLLNFLSSSESQVRHFHFEKDRQPEAKTQIGRLSNGADFETAANALAKKLHEAQLDATKGAIEIQSGDLLTLTYERDGHRYGLLAKLEQMNFLNRSTGSKDEGFPFDKGRLLKTCHCALIEEEGNWVIEDVTVFDSTAAPSKFWWHGFLELTETTNDANNSKRAYQAWKNFIETEVRPIAKHDALLLLNAVGMKFRNKEPYIHSAVVSSILANYVPENPSLKMSELATKASKLPAQSRGLGKQFDATFEIDPSACNIRMRPIKLTDQIDLLLKTPIENLKEVVRAVVDKGEKGVFIASEKGFNEVSATE